MDFPALPDGAILQFWYAAPRAWEAVTEDYEFEDGGKDFNEVSDDPVRRWRYEVVIPAATHMAAKAIADVYETFFNTVRYSQPFDFVDKYSTSWSNVYIEKGGYTRTHDANKSWVIYIKFQLVGYNSVGTLVDLIPPSVPQNVTAVGISSSQIRVSWDASATAPGDPTPLSGYEVFVDGNDLFDVGNVLTYVVGSLGPGTGHEFNVRSYDTAAPRNRSAYSADVIAFTSTPVISMLVDDDGNAMIDDDGNAITILS